MKITKKGIGAYLRKLRKKKRLSKNHFKKVGLVYREVTAIEEGSTNYTIDKLLTYQNELNKKQDETN